MTTTDYIALALAVIWGSSLVWPKIKEAFATWKAEYFKTTPPTTAIVTPSDLVGHYYVLWTALPEDGKKVLHEQVWPFLGGIV